MIRRQGLTLITSLAAIAGCALPQPTQIERQDFIPKREVLLADIVRTAQEDYARGRMFDAELGLRKALVLAPDVTLIVMNLGKTLAKNGQAEEADRIFSRLLDRKGRDVELLNFIGESFFEGDRLETALEYFEKARRIIDEQAEAGAPLGSGIIERTVRNIGTASFRLGDLPRALCSVHEAYDITQSPDNLIRLVRLESARGASANVDGLISNFFMFNPGNSDPRLFLLRAIARVALGRNEQAVEDLNAALKREAQIQEYAVELRLMAAAFIPPAVDEDGVLIEEEDEEEETLPEKLKDTQRLYIPGQVLEALDQWREKKEQELAEE